MIPMDVIGGEIMMLQDVLYTEIALLEKMGRQPRIVVIARILR
jgi:hypothetical protein